MINHGKATIQTVAHCVHSCAKSLKYAEEPVGLNFASATERILVQGAKRAAANGHSLGKASDKAMDQKRPVPKG